MSKNQNIVKRIDNAIYDINKKKSNLFFFVVDSKNIPNSSMAYIYQMAKYFSTEGYNVTMLYQLPNEYTQEEYDELIKKDEYIDEDRVFHDASTWMGEEYSGIPHLNISKDEWKVSPSDFLFIPEVFSSLMFETYKHNIPCKRYVILQDFNLVTEFIPLGVQWSNYGIYDAICTTKLQENKIKEVFPYIRTTVLNPYIDDCFRSNVKPKKLIVNVIAKDQKDVHKIIKPFYWKYPIYNFISFRDVRNFPRHEYANILQEGAITIWVDSDSAFGYSPLEAMRCNNIVIGKMTDDIMEWSGENGKLYDNVIWFNNINDVHKIIASVIGAWMRDEIPEELKQAVEKTNRLYTFSDWKEKANDLIKSIMDNRIKELEETKIIAKQKETNE